MDPERAQRLIDEQAYWSEILKLLQEQAGAIGEAAETTVEAVVSLFSLMSVTDEAANRIVGKGMDSCNESLDKLQNILASLMTIIRLIEGRQKYLQKEMNESRDE